MKILCKNIYWPLNKEYNINKILYLLTDRPDYINYNNDFYWYNIEQLHRDYDLPVYINIKGHAEWCKNDQTHRENNKPAIIWSDGFEECWINGNFIKEIK